MMNKEVRLLDQLYNSTGSNNVSCVHRKHKEAGKRYAIPLMSSTSSSYQSANISHPLHNSARLPTISHPQTRQSTPESNLLPRRTPMGSQAEIQETTNRDLSPRRLAQKENKGRRGSFQNDPGAHGKRPCSTFCRYSKCLVPHPASGYFRKSASRSMRQEPAADCGGTDELHKLLGMPPIFSLPEQTWSVTG